jgi:hypothetical protein
VRKRSNQRIGRILTTPERAARMSNETAEAVDGEILRSAFAISDHFIMTAWHCIRDEYADGAPLWFRLRRETAGRKSYLYLPVRVTNYDELFDVAALTIDLERLAEVDLPQHVAAQLLAEIVIPLDIDVRDNDQLQVIGFSENHTGADSDTNSARVVAASVPLGNVSGLKLYCEALAAASPVNPYGMSGGPVLRTSRPSDQGAYQAVGIIRAAPRGLQEGTASGGSLIATSVEDIADRIPEIGIAIAAVRHTRASPQLLSLTRDMNAAKVFLACGRTLQKSLVKFTDPERGPLSGWPHFYNEEGDRRRPTAIGTAYGFKLSMVIGERCHELDQAALTETLWKLRREDGGWAARTGVGIGRPEVSALVLGALATGGCRRAAFAEAVSVFEDGLTPAKDPVGMEHTYVVCSVIRGMVRIDPRSPLLPELRAALLAGAIRDRVNGNLTCWSDRMLPHRKDLTPSMPHTAQAIVALARVGQLIGDDEQTRAALNEATRWLISRRDLSNKTEQIRRQVVGEDYRADGLMVRHFTAAWVARALLLAPPAEFPTADGLLTDAIHGIWGNYRDGYWEWEMGERPVWMTYQSACVLRDFALRTSTPL